MAMKMPKNIQDHKKSLGEKMNLLHLNKYSTAAILLFGAAAFFIDLALLTSRADFLSSEFLIAGHGLRRHGDFYVDIFME